MTQKHYDVIVIGAGSLGVPTALALAESGASVLVIEPNASVGQLSNKKAIGGIRATHSDYGKIKVCQRSIEIFSTWKEKNGDDIGWLSNGYAYPAHNEKDEKKLKDLMKIQLSHGLNIRWISPEELSVLAPGIRMEGLRGSTFSPEDGSASPLLSTNAFYFKSLKKGAEYRFHERVTAMKTEGNRIVEVVTDKGSYSAGTVVNAAGAYAADIGKMIGLNLPVMPDNHEAAITEPVERFLGPMIVDMRPGPRSLNYYFYQNNEGQVVFCITPEPAILGVDNDNTSEYFPLVAKRMVELYPRLAQLRVRRSWRGQYPNTPDGFPLVGESREYVNFVNNIGACGQGYMLGPGMGELTARIVLKRLSEDDHKILKSFDPYREFSGMELFK